MYIIATIKPWNINNFKKIKGKKFILINNPKKLKFEYLKKLKPKYIFFPHWSYIVPEKIINNFFCICFHETNLPYGRGGSPIQNLIIRNKKNSYISAIKMTNKIDAGPIIMKKKYSLEGSAEDIYQRSSKIVFLMIKKIIQINIKLKPQKGKIVNFKRLKNNSLINKNDDTLIKVYNKIRMLDAQTYDKARINLINFKYEFYNVKKINNTLKAKVIIKKND